MYVSTGLGVSGEGLKAPVIAKSKVVIGEAAAHEPKKEDDLFDEFRKRNMLVSVC